MNHVQAQINRLSKKFPKMWFKDGSEFSPDHVGTIWTGEGSFLDVGGTEHSAFCYWGYSDTSQVHPKFSKVLDNMGLYASFYDGGTVFLYPNS